MKKITLIALLLSFAVGVQAQKTILFKYKYLPKHTYKVATKNDMEMEMAMSGDSAANAQLQASGMKSPMIMKMVMDMGYTMQTETEAANKNVPFTLTYTTFNAKALLNNVETPIPASALVGQVIKGECNAEGILQFNELPGGTASDALKNAIKEIVNKMSNVIKFPEKPLSVGDTFTQDIPMNIPAAGMNMDFNIKTVYKLTEIKDNLAYFDTNADFDMNINTEKDGITLTGRGNGSGPGKMVFNISKSFPQSMIADLGMNFTMNIKNVKMEMKIKSKSNMSNEVAAD